MKLCFTPLILLSALVGTCNVSFADSTLPISPLLKKESGAAADEWRVSVSPYVWASGIKGKVGQFGQPPAKLNSSFSDIISETDLAFMGAAEARYKRFSLIGDVMYAQLSGGGNSQYGVLSRKVDISSETFSGFLGAGYSVLEGDRGHLDVIGGGRLWHASTTLSLIHIPSPRDC